MSNGINSSYTGEKHIACDNYVDFLKKLEEKTEGMTSGGRKVVPSKKGLLGFLMRQGSSKHRKYLYKNKIFSLVRSFEEWSLSFFTKHRYKFGFPRTREAFNQNTVIGIKHSGVSRLSAMIGHVKKTLEKTYSIEVTVRNLCLLADEVRVFEERIQKEPPSYARFNCDTKSYESVAPKDVVKIHDGYAIYSQGNPLVRDEELFSLKVARLQEAQNLTQLLHDSFCMIGAIHEVELLDTLQTDDAKEHSLDDAVKFTKTLAKLKDKKAYLQPLCKSRYSAVRCLAQHWLTHINLRLKN